MIETLFVESQQMIVDTRHWTQNIVCWVAVKYFLTLQHKYCLVIMKLCVRKVSVSISIILVNENLILFKN